MCNNKSLKLCNLTNNLSGELKMKNKQKSKNEI